MAETAFTHQKEMDQRGKLGLNSSKTIFSAKLSYVRKTNMKQ